MTYLIFGFVILLFGLFFLRKAVKTKNREGVIGFTAIVIAAWFLILFYGLFFRRDR